MVELNKGCAHAECLLPAHCEFCGGVCIMHCVGQANYWVAFWYFWRLWRGYVRSRW